MFNNLLFQLILVLTLTCLVLSINFNHGMIKLQPQAVSQIASIRDTKRYNIQASIVNEGENIILAIKKGILRLTKGTKGLLIDFKRSQSLKKKKQLEQISFSEYKFLENNRDDWNKLLRLVITIPFSPEFFFYSYLVIPLLFSANSPWAWQSFPTSFSLPGEEDLRRSIIEKRRMQLFIHSIEKLKGADVETYEFKKKGPSRAEDSDLLFHVALIEKALKSTTNNFEEALKALDPWYQFPTSSSEKRLKGKESAVLKNIPWTVVKEGCRALGVDGLPNVFLIRRLNLGEISKYVDKVRDSDNYLAKIDLVKLDYREVVDACFERCIRTSGKSDKDLRKELHEWCAIVNKPLSTDKHRSTNQQNRRLTMMALNMHRDFKKADFTSTYRMMMN